MPLTLRFGALLLALLYAAGTDIAQAIDIGTTSSFRRQRFEAWGTSLAWMGNEIGGWSASGPRDELMDLLFDQTNNLGLNFVRYNIGAGQNPALSIPRPGAEMDGWVPNAPFSISDTTTWQWDWNADATQRWVLDAALARGVNQIEGFANSAPWWMTISQDSTGAPSSGQSNLAQSNFDEFAHYLLEVAEHFDSNLGIRFNTLAPMNEPGAGWWTSPGNQEGMNIPQGQNQALLIQAVGSEIQSRGIDIDLVAPEETSASETIDSWQNSAYDALTKSYVDQINTHTYPFNGGSSSSTLSQLHSIAQNDGKKIFASEFGTNSSTAVDGGITLANQITKDLRYLQTPGWTYWQAIENNNGSGWGLIIAPFEGAETFLMRRQYQVMRQFSSYIRPGAHIVNTSDIETVAAYDPRTGTTTIVFTNDETSNDTNNYDLLDKSAEYTRVIRTSSSESFQSLGPASVNGSQISVTNPGEAVSTIVVHHQPNLIQNANFELGGASNGSQSINDWQVQGGGFYNFEDNSNDSSEAGALWADNPSNSGSAYQTGIGDAQTDLTGVAYELSLDVKFQDAGASLYDADMYLALEFYGADDQTLAHQSVNDFQTLITPAIGVYNFVPTDTEWRTFRSERFIAPAGTRYVRPVIRYGNVESGSTDWVFFDNAYLQEAHPAADGREWNVEGNGDWSDDSNWLGHALVDSHDSNIYLGNAITQASVVTLDDSQLVSELTFFSEHQYQLQGTGELQIGGPGVTSLVDVRRGSHLVSVDATLVGDVSLQTLPGTEITFDSALDLDGNTLTKVGAGILDLASGFEMNGGHITSYLTSSATIELGSDAMLDGTFELFLSPGQSLQLGDSFELTSYSSLADTFDALSLPSLASGLAWDIDYGATALTVEVVNFTLEADFDGDGDVDHADLLKWEADYGVGAGSDADGDGDSDGLDLLIWQRQFGSSSQAPSAAAEIVPEPHSLVVLFLLAVFSCLRRSLYLDLNP